MSRNKCTEMQEYTGREGKGEVKEAQHRKEASAFVLLSASVHGERVGGGGGGGVVWWW
jgi:hypothetical protein